jgi:hypothetical protein
MLPPNKRLVGAANADERARMGARPLVKKTWYGCSGIRGLTARIVVAGFRTPPASTLTREIIK